MMIQMKKHTLSFSLFAILAMGIAFTGCKPEPEGELGTAFDKVAGIAGTWEIVSFTQQDMNNPVKEERDLSEFYIIDGEDRLKITFATEGRTYSVASGAGKNYFGDSGTWGFDDDDVPSQLYLYGATDTLEFELGSMVREFDNTLNIELPRYCDDGAGNVIETVTYKFRFTRK
jgi:Domain of unknown function (DUF5004)